jgi:hypothetical protein
VIYCASDGTFSLGAFCFVPFLVALYAQLYAWSTDQWLKDRSAVG